MHTQRDGVYRVRRHPLASGGQDGRGADGRGPDGRGPEPFAMGRLLEAPSGLQFLRHSFVDVGAVVGVFLGSRHSPVRAMAVNAHHQQRVASRLFRTIACASSCCMLPWYFGPVLRGVRQGPVYCPY